MNKEEIADFVKSRDEAFISFVMTDDLSKFRKHCKKYKVILPTDKKVVKASIYKAVQECTNISDDVKAVAFMKCSMLGFKPFIDWEDNDE